MGRGAVGAVRDAVFNLLGIRHPFRSVDGQTHTLSFRGEGTNMRLIVQSVPTDVAVFLDRKRIQDAQGMQESLSLLGEPNRFIQLICK